MKYFLITLTVFLLHLSLSAQTIQGTVTDQANGEGLPFANVVLELNGVQIAGTTTDLEGNYILTGFPAGTYDVFVIYVGYKDLRTEGIVVNESATVAFDIEMTPPSEGLKLDEIVVKAYKVPLIEMDNMASGSTITSEEISRMPRKRTGSLIATTAGLSRKKKGKSTTFRGSREGDDNVFVDGVRTRRSTVPAADMEELEYGRNGLPILYAKARKETKNDPKPTHPNTEDYSPITENNFKKVKNDPLSTFSIDVDRAAYSNVRRFINDNQLPPADAVRIEEMINYFQYDYKGPKEEHPFAIHTEVAPCPWNSESQLIQIGIQGEKMDLENAPNSNLVFLIDVSGSMSSSNKLPLVQAGLKLLVDNLKAEDRVAIVVYAGAERLVLESTPGTKKAEIKAAIDILESGGSTAGASGIKLAYQIAKENFIPKGNNRVILATDGDFNVGVSSDGGLLRLIEERRDDHIFLTTLGFGMGNYKDNKMELLADKGNGNYAYIDNIREAKKVLVTEMVGTLYTIAKDVKIQIEFNPAMIKKYRLIGYENRLLNKEDFNDDKKDAGELGAGHTVTALYEIVLNEASSERDPKSTNAVDPLKYQKSSLTSIANESKELLHLKLRYKAPKGRTSQLIQHPVYKEAVGKKTSNNFRFATAVASFGMLLRNSKYVGKLTYSDILQMAKGAKGEDQEGYRAEFIQLVETCDLQFAKR